MYVNDIPNLHTQHTLISYPFGLVMFCSLRGEGRRDWESRVKNGVKMKHMFTLELIEFILVKGKQIVNQL